MVVDAKYKGTAVKPLRQIASDDLYESLAFLEAQQSDVAVLVYPGGGSSSQHQDTGLLTQFDEVKVRSRRVIGVTVCTNGIGRRRGLELFGRRLGECLLEIASVPHPSIG